MAEEACTIPLRKAVGLEGTVSREHGVAKKTCVENGERNYLRLMYGKEGLLIVAKIKDALYLNHT